MMPVSSLSEVDKQLLLKVARQAMESAVRGGALSFADHRGLSPDLLQDGASFVTLTERGNLRGCIGALEAYQPLVDDVQEHAIAAATQDYRFRPVQPAELPLIQIEISHLTPPVLLEYTDPDDLLQNLHPGADGVILQDGRARATFLPQVWEQLPSKSDFLDHLCRKMGAPASLWRSKHLQVRIYHVEEFHEED